MPHKSRWSVDIPLIYLHSLILGSPNDALPDSPAFVDCQDPENLNITWAQYALWCRRFAVGLKRAGLEEQGRVLIYSGNNVMFPVAFMGIILAGGIVTTANPAYVAREVAYQLTDSEPQFLLVTQSSVGTALEAARTIKYPQDRIFVFDDAPLLNRGQDIGSLRHWSRLISNIDDGNRFSWKEAESINDVTKTIAILYSSGTTGVPKGVQLTHYGLVANCLQMSALWNLDSRYSMDNPKREIQRMLGLLPMYHGYGLLWFATITPFRRNPSYIMKRFSLKNMLESMERFRITDLTLAPPMLIMMAKSPEARKFDLSSVRKVVAGAAPLSREMCEKLEALWPSGQINVKQGWGMTEVPISILNWDDREISTSAAVGEPLPNCEVKIMDEDGIYEVAQGERGELWCKSPTMMSGYWRNPEATRNAIMPDGWLRTGDIAIRDRDGMYVIVDRKKELIKVKGNQVAPAELEGLLLDHPDVQDAAVIGIKCGEDEQPMAYIVPKLGALVSVDQILMYMAERTAKVKHITAGIIFTEEIPKSPSGKILRRILRERMADPAERAKVQRASPPTSMISARL